MKWLASNRVHIAWLLLTAIVSGGGLIVWKLAVSDAPPTGALFIHTVSKGDTASATITAFGGLLGGRPAQTSVREPMRTIPAPTTTIVGALPDAPTEALLRATPTQVMIWVYVSGAVANPGVYNLPDGTRVADAVAAAGGALPGADLEGINLAQRLYDEAHVSVYMKGEEGVTLLPEVQAGRGQPNPAALATPTKAAQVPARQPQTTRQTAPAGQPGAKPTPSTIINLNTATAAELQLLPGVGPALAARIVADREQNGPFKTVQDLMRISGIKEGIMAKIAVYVTIGP